MKSVSETVSLAELLRYGFSGGAFLISLVLARNGLDASVTAASALNAETSFAFVILAVVIGSFIYTTHRALVHYPIIARLITARLDKRHPCQQLTANNFFENTYKRDLERWSRRCLYSGFQRNLDLWSSHIHFLYGWAWGTFVGTILGRWISPGVNGSLCSFFMQEQGWTTFKLLMVTALSALIGALWQDYIAHRYERELLSEKSQEFLLRLKSIGEHSTN